MDNNRRNDDVFTVREQHEYEDIREIVYNLNVTDPIVGSLLQRYHKLRLIYKTRLNSWIRTGQQQ